MFRASSGTLLRHLAQHGRSLSTSTGAKGGRFFPKLVGATVVGVSAGVGIASALETKVPPLTGNEKIDDVDALIIGAGIMGASVSLMLKLLHPDWRVRLIERLDRVAAESSNEWHNAGTGHAALCEPNYTVLDEKTGEMNIDKAVATNAKFLISLQWWTWLVEVGVLPDASFIQPVPHITFAHGDDGVSWLKKRVAALAKLPSFAATEYSEDYDQIEKWSGLLCSGRPRDGEKIACSRHPDGTECNFGLLTRCLVQSFIELGGELQLLSTVEALQQQDDKRWVCAVQKNDLAPTTSLVRARYVFAGAGGGSLKVLQKAGIPEIKGYAAMPVSGKFLVCQDSRLIEKSNNKIYGRAAIGAPPMSVPHLDWRTIYGKDCIFFGPFAGFSPQCFKFDGSIMDWLSTLNVHNIIPMAAMAFQNLDLVKFLMGEVVASKETQLATLRQFYPAAQPDDWTMVWAGQRLQIVKPDAKAIGKLQFGTEVVASADNTIVGLLGASPGASVSPYIAIEVLSHMEAACHHEKQWHAALAQMIPSYGRDINKEPGLYDSVLKKAKDVLLYGETSGHRACYSNLGRFFDRLDVNSDGNLSYSEVASHLKKRGVDKKTIDAIIKKIDTDKSGDISRQEFQKGFVTFLAGGLGDVGDDVCPPCREKEP